MADNSLLANFLDQACEVANLATKLGRAFQEEVQGEAEAADWDVHKPTFDRYCQALQQLAPQLRDPPDGSGAVPECLRRAAETAREICGKLGTSDFQYYAEYRDFFPDLNSVASDLSSAINHVHRALDSIDHFAFLDDMRVNDTGSQTDAMTAEPHNRLEQLAGEILALLPNIAGKELAKRVLGVVADAEPRELFAKQGLALVCNAIRHYQAHGNDRWDEVIGSKQETDPAVITWQRVVNALYPDLADTRELDDRERRERTSHGLPLSGVAKCELEIYAAWEVAARRIATLLLEAAKRGAAQRPGSASANEDVFTEPPLDAGGSQDNGDTQSSLSRDLIASAPQSVESVADLFDLLRLLAATCELLQVCLRVPEEKLALSRTEQFSQLANRLLYTFTIASDALRNYGLHDALAARYTAPVRFGSISSSSYACLAKDVALAQVKVVEGYWREIHGGKIVHVTLNPQFRFKTGQVAEIRKRFDNVKPFAFRGVASDQREAIRVLFGDLIVGLRQEQAWAAASGVVLVGSVDEQPDSADASQADTPSRKVAKTSEEYQPMVDESTRERAVSLAHARIVPLEKSLTLELGGKSQELIDRGLYNSSIQVTDTLAIAERNLEERAELVAKTITEVCEAHAVGHSGNLAADLQQLFREIYDRHVSSVRARWERAVPEANRRLCRIKRFGPDVGRYEQEIALYADGLRSRTPACEKKAGDRVKDGATVATNKRFQVAFSFAGEDRAFVEHVAAQLAVCVGRERVLYDKYHEAEFARPNLSTYLQELYLRHSELIAVFLSDNYQQKEWCGVEWRAIQELIKRGEAPTVMLLRFDDAEIPGQYSTDGYVSIGDRTDRQISDLILERLRINASRTADNGTPTIGPETDISSPAYAHDVPTAEASERTSPTPLPGEYEDGTNLRRGTAFYHQLGVTEDWYRPDESEAPADWKDRWIRLRVQFENIVNECRPVACLVIEKRSPAYPPGALSYDDLLAGRPLIQGGGGLGCEPSQLFDETGRPLFGVFPILDARGTPIANSAGEAFGFRFGLSRQFFLYTDRDAPQESRALPGPRLSELARDAVALLYRLPANVAVSLWRNWRSGFSRRAHSDEYLWLDALVELACERAPGDALHATRYAWSANTSIELEGDGRFPRIPDMSWLPASIPIQENNGYPLAWRSALPDLARASVIAIDVLLERASGSSEHSPSSITPRDGCFDQAEQAARNGGAQARERADHKAKTPERPRPAVDFVIVTPLVEERDSFLARLPDYRKVPPSEEDIRTYYTAELPVHFSDGSTATYSIIVLPLTRMGHVDAASATGDAIRRWNPRYVLLAGIAGGVKKAGVRIGDVLISDQVVDYELQKLGEGKPDMRWQVHRVDQRLLIAAQNFQDESWHDTAARRYDKRQPTIHFGPVCTGNKVIADESLIEQFRDVWTKLIGVEMEAGGVANAASQASRQPGLLMIRGVSDLADDDKGSGWVKRWRPYACQIAAAWTIEFLKSGPVPVTATVEPTNEGLDN